MTKTDIYYGIWQEIKERKVFLESLSLMLIYNIPFLQYYKTLQVTIFLGEVIDVVALEIDTIISGRLSYETRHPRDCFYVRV